MPQKPTRVRRSRWAVVLAVLAAPLTFIAAGIPVYVLPQTDAPEHVDVVIVLGPVDSTRMDAALALIDSGRADNLMVSVDDPTSDRSFIRRVCDPDLAQTVICFRPSPYTTEGEGRALAAATAEHGWTSAAVITQTSHISRARLWMDRCWDGQVAMIDGESPRTFGDWIYQYAYQTTAYVKAAFVTTSC